MSKKYKKILLIVGILVAIASPTIFLLAYSETKDLEVDFLDVGQGDAILIKSPQGQNILIDGGPDSKIIKELGKNLSWWDRKIDLMILTHPHDDHVGGLVDVLKRYKVKKIIYSGVLHSSPAFLAWLNLIREKNISVNLAAKPQRIYLDSESYLKIIFPFTDLSGKEVPNLNNSSLLIKLIHEQNSFLFMGDAEIEIEQELLAKNIDLKADVLKLGHHGSDTSTSLEFLQTVSPDIAIIQVGKDNDFGHPSRRTLKRLKRMDIKTLRNDIDATIKIISDGKYLETYP